MLISSDGGGRWFPWSSTVGGGNICLRICASLAFRYLRGLMILIYFRLYNCHSRRPPSTWNESTAPTTPWHSSLAAYKAPTASRSFKNVTDIMRMIPKPAIGTLRTSTWHEHRSLAPIRAVAQIIPASPTRSNGYDTNTVCGVGSCTLGVERYMAGAGPSGFVRVAQH